MISRPFRVKYTGRCTECNQDIHPGEDARFDGDDDLVHVDCVEPPRSRRPQLTACPACWLVHAGECM